MTYSVCMENAKATERYTVASRPYRPSTEAADLMICVVACCGWKLLTIQLCVSQGPRHLQLWHSQASTWHLHVSSMHQVQDFRGWRCLPAVPLRMCWASLGSTRRSVNKAKEADCAEYSVATLRCLAQLSRPAPASLHTAGSDIAFSRSCWHCAEVLIGSMRLLAARELEDEGAGQH